MMVLKMANRVHLALIMLQTKYQINSTVTGQEIFDHIDEHKDV